MLALMTNCSHRQSVAEVLLESDTFKRVSHTGTILNSQVFSLKLTGIGKKFSVFLLLFRVLGYLV